MSLVRSVTKSVNSTMLDPMSYRGMTGTPMGTMGGGDMWLFGAGAGGYDVHFSYSSLNDAIRAYECCPPVAAIINRKTQAHMNGKTWILNTQGKAKAKEATGEVATRLRTLLAKPNFLQSWSQFDAMVKVYVQLFGFCPILPVKPVGFDATYAKALWILPPFLLEIEEKDLLFYNGSGSLIKSIKLTYRGQTAMLNPDDIFFIKDTTISLRSFVIPQSRVKSLTTPIDNIIGALYSRKVLINRRGALGILSNAGKDSISTIPLDPTEKEQVQADLTRYGLMGNQWQVIVTNAALQWQQMGYPTKELMLFEEVDGSTMMICDVMGYNYRLLSSEKSNSLGGSDVKEFRAMNYEEYIIPEANDMFQQWNQFFELEKYNLKIEKDFSDSPAMQQDAEKAAKARKERNNAYRIEFLNNMLTVNEWRIKNNEDPISEAWGEMYYFQMVAQGMTFGDSKQPTQSPGKETDDDDEDKNNSGNGK